MQPNWPLLATGCLALLVVQVSNGSADEPQPPEGTCIVELQLPAGATVTVDSKNYGDQRKLRFDKLERQQTSSRRITIHFKDGSREERTILLHGARRVRLAVAPPGRLRPELVLQTGHTMGVSAVAFGPDGRRILTGSDDKTAILWDAASGQKLRTFQGHTTRVRSAVFSPDGRQVLTGSEDNTAVLWDATSGERLHTFQGNTGANWWSSSVRSAVFSPDGRQVLVACADDNAILCDAASGQKLRTFQGHTNIVFSVVFSPDGQQVLTGSGDDTAILWHVGSGQKLRTFRGHTGTVHSVAFSPDGRQVLTGSWDKTAILWDTASGEKLRTLRGHTDYVHSAAFSPDGRLVLTGAGDGIAFLWDAASGEKLRTFQGNTGQVWSVAFSPDGRQVLTGSAHNIAILWDAASGQELRTFRGHTNAVSSVAFGPDGRQALMGTDANTAILWDVASGKWLRTFQGHTGPVDSVAFSPDGRQVLTGARAWDNAVILWDAASGQKLHRFKNTYIAAFSPDGRQMLTWSQDMILRDAASGQKLRTFKGRTGEVSSVVFSPDGRHVLTGSWDKTAILWDVASGKKLRTFQGHTRVVYSVAFNPDGQQVLTGSWDKTAILWDAASGERLRTFKGHTRGVNSVAFSLDGRQVLTGSSDKTALLWNAASGEKLHTFRGHTDRVDSVAFSPDGRQVLTGSGDGTTSLWDLATGQELAQLISLDAGKDWLVVTPEGLFDGSEVGKEKVSFRVGGGLNVVPVGRFFQEFYHPGLLHDLWKGERPMPKVQFAHQSPPSLRIVSPSKDGPADEQVAAIETEVVDAGGGITGPIMMHNGTRVNVPYEDRREGKTLRRTFKVPLLPGDNFITVRAACEDGSWESEPATVVLKYAKSIPKGDLFLVAAGIAKYAEPALARLKYPPHDAEKLADLFRQRGSALYGQVHPTLLIDAQATRPRIIATVRKVAAQTRPQDTLVVFLAGHGAMAGQQYYFLPQELQRRAAELQQDLPDQGLPAQSLGELMGTAPALKRILILDTCAAGGAVESVREKTGFAVRGSVQRLGWKYGLLTVAGAASSQAAMESDQLGHGVLSYALLAALNAVDGGPLAGNPIELTTAQVVETADWVKYARSRVPPLTKTIFGREQEVQYNQEGRSFPILSLRQ
jgi:WD40 repeat protein